MKLSRIAIFIVLLLSPLALTATPQIRQIFPPRNFFLGQSRIWTVEIRHPAWEAYTVKINDLPGAEMSLLERKSRIEIQEMISLYQIKILPVSLNIADAPSILICDGKGQNTVLNGSRLLIQSLSGNSLVLKDPLHPTAPPSAGKRLMILGIVMASLLLALAISIWKRKRAARPKQVLQRQMKRILKEIALFPNKYPAALEKIFRSELFWGERAEALTATELFDLAGSDPDLRQLAETLQRLEQYRYSDTGGFKSDDRVRQSILIGLEILR